MAQPAVLDGSAPAPCRMTSSTRRMAARPVLPRAVLDDMQNFRVYGAPAVPDGSAPAPCRMTSSTRRMAAAQFCAARRPRPPASWQAAPPLGADPPLGGAQGAVGSKGSSRLDWLGSADVPGCVVAASGGPIGSQTRRASSRFTCSTRGLSWILGLRG